MTCSIGGCSTEARQLGMCVKHYARFHKHGNTQEPWLRRLMFRDIEFTADCWWFTGCRDKHGYGRTSRNGEQILAHRLVYELFAGPIPEGLELDHLCRNPPCVNPEHLEPVTHQENVRRGRAGYAADDLCKHGHDLNDPANVYRHTRGRNGRKCKPCALRNSQRAYQRKKEQQHVQ